MGIGSSATCPDVTIDDPAPGLDGRLECLAATFSGSADSNPASGTLDRTIRSVHANHGQPMGQLVVVDAAVAQWQSLVSGITASEDVQVVVLDVDRDGISQLTEVLASQERVDGLHLISHGGQASLTLGSATLNTENLPRYSDQLISWQGALTDNADILLYGCNVAEGKSGVEFVNRLAELTGADVAASQD